MDPGRDEPGGSTVGTFVEALLFAGARMVGEAGRSVVQVRNGGRGAGAGVVWPGDGLVVTNHHVVAGRGAVRVVLAGGRELGARVVGRDGSLDLALLRLDGEPGDLPAAPVGDSDGLRVGELVFAIGHPWGRSGAVTAGVVSGIGPAGGPGGARASYGTSYVQSDVALAPGNSGGPLLDARGRVVGINAMIFGRLALSIPSNAVSAWVAASGGRPRLGVRLLPVTVRGAAAEGFVVSAVETGSPAAKAGLLVGDVLLGTADGPAGEAASLPALIARSTGPVRLRVMRGGEILSIEVLPKVSGPGRAA